MSLPVHAAPPPWLDALATPAWLVDAASLRVNSANAAAAAWFEQDAGALCDQPAAALLGTLEDALFWAEPPRHAAGAGHVCEMALAQGDEAALPRWVERRVSALPPAEGRAPMWLVQLSDISARRLAERAAAQALAELQSALEAVDEGILMVDLRGRVRAFNRRFATLWGLPDTALARGDHGAIQRWMQSAVLEPQPYAARLAQIAEQPLLTAQDTLALVDGALVERHSAPQWSGGRPIGRIYSFRLLNAGRAGAPRARGVQGQDPLTGYPNRAAFVQMAARAIEQARSGQAPLALLCVEYDRRALFALDGDAAAQTMTELGAALAAQVREPQRVARLGAGRFAVLLDPAGVLAATAVARRLVAASRAQPHRSHRAVPLACGVAAFPDAGLDATTLLAHAERALDHAHASGGEQPVCVFDRAQDPAADAVQRLQAAHAAGQIGQLLTLQVAPRVDARTGRLCAVQATARWSDAARGAVPAESWQREAEHAGLAAALGEWALGEALALARAWHAAGQPLVVALGVTTGHLAQPGFARRVAAQIEAMAVNPQALELELSLTPQALAEWDAVQANAQALHALGVRLRLADWGGAELPLARARALPLAGVKLAPALLQEVPQQGQCAQLATAVVRVAQALSLEVCADGVATPAQRRFAQDAGCDAWQGDLAAPPMPPDALRRRLGAWAGGGDATAAAPR